jgi:predicted NBD/HSP70 family sugar kinase
MEFSGLSRATVFSIADELRAAGLVIEDRSEVPSGGRRPSVLSINPEAGFALGIELNAGDALLVLLDMVGSIRQKRTLLHSDMGADDVLSYVGEEAKQLIAASPEARGRMLGVGVSVPGVLDVASGRVLLASNLEWLDTPVSSRLAGILDLPVSVSNHAVSGALAELWLGAQRNPGSYLYVYVGSGIGAGLVSYEASGSLHTRSMPWFGHMSLDAEGPVCRCGNRGCLELVASTRAAARAYAALAGRDAVPTWDFVAERVGQDDPIAIAVVKKMGLHLAVGIANLLTFSEPNNIILGGRLNRVGEFLTKVVRDELSSRLARRNLPVELDRSELGEEAGAVGIAVSILERALVTQAVPVRNELGGRTREMR